MELKKNTGALFDIQPTDYRAGANTAIVYEERLEDGQWDSLLPMNESQRYKIDRMACVTYSALNSVEAQVRYLTGQEFNYSDRFIAKLSDTTREGNYAYKVADTIRHKGLVLEEDWKDNPDFDWDEYYSAIPEEIIATGQDFLDEFDAQYEWIGTQNPFGGQSLMPVTEENLKKHLKHAPIQIGVPICSPWNQENIPTCGKTRSEHAILLYGYDEDGWKVFDHYSPYRKRLSYDYPIAWAFKYLITKKSNKNMELLEKFDKKIVMDSEAGRSGSFAYVKNGKMMVAKDQKDLLEIMATYSTDNFGTGLPAKVWDELPKVDWKKRNEQ